MGRRSQRPDQLRVNLAQMIIQVITITVETGEVLNRHHPVRQIHFQKFHAVGSCQEMLHGIHLQQQGAVGLGIMRLQTGLQQQEIRHMIARQSTKRAISNSVRRLRQFIEHDRQAILTQLHIQH